MARIHPITMRMPDADGWTDIKKALDPNERQEVALRETLQEAFDACEEMRRALAFSELKAGLKKIGELLKKVERALESQDVVNSLTALETYGAMAHIISPSAVRELNGYREIMLPKQAIDRLLADRQGDGISPSVLDELSLPDRQRDLDGRTIDAMKLIIRQMRRPIDNALSQSKPDKGGNRPQTDRELLIFLLARDAAKIIGNEASLKKGIPFVSLCAWALNACEVSTVGLEDAVDRCLRRHQAWLEWYQFPQHAVEIRELTEDEFGAIPNDPEAL